MKKCAKCHQAWEFRPRTDEQGRAICPHCGYVAGESLVPSAWACEECANTILDHGGDDRPICEECGSQMSCLTAKPSGVSGAGTDDLGLEMGLELLMEAQEADLNLGSELLRDAQEDV